VDPFDHDAQGILKKIFVILNFVAILVLSQLSRPFQAIADAVRILIHFSN
jgi:hypothetical protein